MVDQVRIPTAERAVPGRPSVRSNLTRKSVFVLRKARTVSHMFRLGWGLRIPFVTRETQQALRRRLLELKDTRSVRSLRILRSELKERVAKVRGLLDPAAESKLAAAAVGGGIVSFDFYDTLFTRAAATPNDVLAFVGHVLHREGLDDERSFATVRLRADSLARLGQHRGDVTLAEIYAAFPDQWDPVRRARAMAIEIETELASLQPRGAVAAFARMTRERGGRAIVVSDTCMDAGFLGRVLERQGLGEVFDEIHASCDALRRKDDGTIWPWLKQTLPGDVPFTHVGDSPNSDVAQPRKAGLAAIGIPSAAATAELRGYPVPRHWRIAQHDWRTGIVLGPAIARIGNDPFVKGPTGTIAFENPYDFGHAVVGPLMFGFMTWILQQAEADGVEALYFLSRDGYFLQSIYEACTAGLEGRVPAARYLYISRRSAMPANLFRSFDPTLLLQSRFKGRLGDLVQGRLGIDVAGFAPGLAEEIVRLPQDRARVIQVMVKHEVEIREALKPSHDNLVAFLDQVGFTSGEGAGLVDFSSSGTIQLALQSIVGRGTIGYYMMISRAFVADDALAGRASACYVDACDHWQLQPVQAAAILIEGLLTAPYGQITDYRRDGDAVVPVYGPEPDSGARFAAIRSTMGGAQAYCRELVEIYGPHVLSIDVPKGDAQAPLGAFLRGKLTMPPALRDAITVEDEFGGNGKMAFYA